MNRLMLALVRGCTDARLRDPEPGTDGASAPASPAPSAPAADAAEPAPAVAPADGRPPAADGSDGDLSSVTLGGQPAPEAGPDGQPAAQPAPDGTQTPGQQAPQVKP